jgi:hypothetical protein
MKFNREPFTYILLILVVFIYSLKGFIQLDPDFGWRLAAGEMYITQGIPETDPFSYTMPSFPWVDHAWLSTSFMYILYKNLGKFITAFMFSVIAVSCLFVATSKKIKGIHKKKYGDFGDAFFVLALAVILSFTGIRAQVVTWFLFGLFIKILFSKRLWNKYKYLTPFHFLLWANFHGGFALGLFSLSLVLAVRTIRTKKIDLGDAAVFTFSVLATLINPYGTGIYREVWSSISDSSLRWSIAEWMPSVMRLNLPFTALLSFSSILIYKYRKKFLPERLLLFLALLVQAFMSIRHVTLWTIFSLSLVQESAKYFKKDMKKIKEGTKRFNKAYKAFWVGTIFMFIYQTGITQNSTRALSENSFYPKEAVVYLKNNKIENEIFSNYDWGGYLIWKLPEKKVFVDGRMPSWRQENAAYKESASAFEDHKNIKNGELKFEEVFEKYDIDTVLWPAHEELGLYGKFAKGISNKIGKLQGVKEEEYDFLDDLKKSGWVLVYEDAVANIYKKDRN